MAEKILMRNDGDGLVFYEAPGANRTTTGFPLLKISPTQIMVGQGGNLEITVTSTNPAASVEVIDAVLSIGGTESYSGTSVKAVKGNVTVTNTGDYLGNACGGWFGLKFDAASGMERGGLAVGLYAEAHTGRTENAQPSAVAYFQSVVSGDGIMLNSPILVLTSTGGGSGDKTKYAFSFGYDPASTTVSTADDGGNATMFRTGGNSNNGTKLLQGIQVICNGADFYIPLIAIGDWSDN